jgi:tetratricopeptide (TPR) repeat protein
LRPGTTGNKIGWIMRLPVSERGSRVRLQRTTGPFIAGIASATSAIVLIAVSLFLYTSPSFAESPGPGQTNAVIEGEVRGLDDRLVSGASLILEADKNPSRVETKTDAKGKFVFSNVSPGSYTLKAEKSGIGNAVTAPLVVSAREQKHLRVILQNAHPASRSKETSSSPESEFKFEDKPNFSVAGITDWTAAGGHGSDTALRTSEALAKETRALKSGEKQETLQALGKSGSGELSESESRLRADVAQTPGSFEANHRLGEFYLRSGKYHEAIPSLRAAYKTNPDDYANARELAVAYQADGNFVSAREQVRNMLAKKDNAELHRVLGDIDEQSNDPLGAEREYEKAAQLDPSEPNYFAWGAELLLHRAIQPAVEVFSKGVAAQPKSARMLAGLGAALYATGSYNQAAQELCEAADLTPADPAPYLFLGKVEKTTSEPLPCVEQRLARFAHDYPDNMIADYYYAVSLQKRHQMSHTSAGEQQVEALLKKAVSLDPKFGEAYLQLGIFYSNNNKLDRAIDAYQNAISADPQLSEAHYRLAQAYKRAGELTKARQEFQLYEQVRKNESEAVERQRRELRQFLVVLRNQPETSLSH